VQPAEFENPAIVLGGTAKLNGPRGAFALQPIGDDSQAFGTPPVAAPPRPDSAAYAVELIELYWASLLRDVAFTEFEALPPTTPRGALVHAASEELTAHAALYAGRKVANVVTPRLLFRGGFHGETVGPYLSQFCIQPTQLGVQPVDQMMRVFLPGQDFMTDPGDWFNVQQGRTPAGTLTQDPVLRVMRTGRDLSAFTHVDELYQAYFAAYLVLAGWQVEANPGSPYSTAAKVPVTNEQPFGTFGHPDIVSTLAAVAKAALDAVWYQKWSVHLRHRPEAAGGLVQLNKTGAAPVPAAAASLDPVILDSHALAASFDRHGSYLLSQAFPEGSPTHPAYPTGHGTVAGACITVLKFFFDCTQTVATYSQPLVPTPNGLVRVAYTGKDAGEMTINGELHKLAHNISFGHGIHAGIHWRSDTDASIRLGEAVALKYLQDRAWYYRENFSVQIIGLDGTLKPPIKNF
jgi:hypothetical protein